MGAKTSTEYQTRKIVVTPTSDAGGSDDMPGRLVLSENSSLKEKQNPIRYTDYPKVIKLVKSSSQQPLPQTLVVNSAQYQANPPFVPPLELSNRRPSHQVMRVMQNVDPFPFQRYPDYHRWNPPQNQVQPGYLTRSHSYDGYNRFVLNNQLPRNVNYNYAYNSPSNNYEYVRNRPVYDDSARLWSRADNNAYMNADRNQNASAYHSGRTRRSSSLSRTSSDPDNSRELDVELVNKYEDDNGTIFRIVKPIGERSRIIHTKYINPDDHSNFVIVESARNTPQPPSQPSPVMVDQDVGTITVKERLQQLTTEEELKENEIEKQAQKIKAMEVIDKHGQKTNMEEIVDRQEHTTKVEEEKQEQKTNIEDVIYKQEQKTNIEDVIYKQEHQPKVEEKEQNLDLNEIKEEKEPEGEVKEKYESNVEAQGEELRKNDIVEEDKNEYKKQRSLAGGTATIQRKKKMVYRNNKTFKMRETISKNKRQN